MKIEHAMSCGVLAVGFAYLFLVTFASIPAEGQEHAKTIVGFMLGSVVSNVISYYWGSSQGSADKSRVIEKELGSGKEKV